jgi:predicted site-specific integrase-resolvase
MGGWGKVKESAQHAGVSERTFRPWLKRGLKHSRLPSGTILIRFSDIDKFLESFAVDDNKVDQIIDEVVKEFQN